MFRVLIGSILAAVAMFLIGFIAYGTPLMKLGYTTAAPAVQLDVQTALKALPGTGTYIIPAGETSETTTAFANGPVAVIGYNAGGFAMVDPQVMVAGLIHMLVTCLIIGGLLYAVRRRITDDGERLQLVLGIAAIGAIFINLASPIWFHTDWRNALYLGGVNFISLAVAGVILAKWFVPKV